MKARSTFQGVILFETVLLLAALLVVLIVSHFEIIGRRNHELKVLQGDRQGYDGLKRWKP